MSAVSDNRRAAASRGAVLLVMCVGYFLVLLDVTIVNVALPTIGHRLRVSVSGLQWVVDGYALALAGLMLTGGTVGDLRGHKRVVLGGLYVFGIASLGCGLAGAAGILIACRVLQGIGAALMLPGTLAVIANAYPDERERARAIGVWAGVGSCALPAGPLLGGVLVQTVGWRWVFLLNVPIVVVASVATARVVTESRARAARRLDLPGAALGAVALVGVTSAFIGRATVARRCPSSSPRRSQWPVAPGLCAPNAALATRCCRWICCAAALLWSPTASPGP